MVAAGVRDGHRDYSVPQYVMYPPPPSPLFMRLFNHIFLTTVVVVKNAR